MGDAVPLEAEPDQVINPVDDLGILPRLGLQRHGDRAGGEDEAEIVEGVGHRIGLIGGQLRQQRPGDVGNRLRLHDLLGDRRGGIDLEHRQSVQ